MSNVRYFSGGTPSTLLADVLLYEGSNEIEFRYYTVPVDGSHAVTVGVQGAGGQVATGAYDYVQLVNDVVLNTNSAASLANTSYRFSLQSASAANPFACFNSSVVAGASTTYFWTASVSVVDPLRGPLSSCSSGSLIVNAAAVLVGSRTAYVILSMTGSRTVINAFGSVSNSSVSGLATGQTAYLYLTNPLLDTSGARLMVTMADGSQVGEVVASLNATSYTVENYTQGTSFAISAFSAFSCGTLAPPPPTYPLPTLSLTAYNSTSSTVFINLLAYANGAICPSLRILNASLPLSGRGCVLVLESLSTASPINSSAAMGTAFSWQAVSLASVIQGLVNETGFSYVAVVAQSAALAYHNLRLSLQVATNGIAVTSPYSLVLNAFTPPPSSSSSSTAGSGTSTTGAPGAISTAGTTAAQAVGDPMLVGFLGQRFQVHGVSGAVYCLVTERGVLVNARFGFLDGPRSCPSLPSTGRRAMACWSHPGSYLVEVAIAARLDDGRIHRLWAAPGNVSTGFASILFDGAPLGPASLHTPSGDSRWDGVGLLADEQEQGRLLVRRISSHELDVRVGHFQLTLQSVDGFINLARLAVTPPTHVAQLSAHGLLGQTWNARRHAGRIAEIEGEVDDYLVVDEDDGVFGTHFPFNRFQPHYTDSSSNTNPLTPD